MEDRISELQGAVRSFLEAFDEPTISASRPVDGLLEIWALAAAIDPSVAAPVESLLTALVARKLTTAEELRRTMDEVEIALLAVEQTTSV
jgi:hypothetical protein